MREVIERSRVNLLALFRALDRLDLAQGLPRRLRKLFDLDADLAEALWALDQPVGRLDLDVMTRDTLDSLGEIPDALHAFLQLFDPVEQSKLATCVIAVRATLAPSDAYLQISGRDPTAR